MAWVGSSIALAIPGGYAVLRPSRSMSGASGSPRAGAAQPPPQQQPWQVVVLADHLTAAPMMGAIACEVPPQVGRVCVLLGCASIDGRAARVFCPRHHPLACLDPFHPGHQLALRWPAPWSVSSAASVHRQTVELWPPTPQVALAWDEGMLLIAGEDGAAAREPLQLTMPPLALVAAGLFVVGICDDGVHVYDR